MWSVAVAAWVFLLAAADGEDKEAEAIKYLTQYGYIESESEDGTRPFVDVDIYNEAIKNFQDFAGLEKTGVLDKETQELMDTPRCGFDDRLANFVKQGRKWTRKDLTYRISTYSSRLSRREVDSQTKKAFAMWQEASSLTFREARSGRADIDIKFVRGNHGDGNPFNGPGGVLAHAYFPRDGRAHFDDAENWSVTPNRGTQVLNTLTHEFGHSLGLSHSRVRGAIMAPFYKGWDRNLRLSDDDIRGIQAIYGRNTGNRPPVNNPRVNPPRVNPPRVKPPRGPIDNKELCSSKIDAFVQTSEGSSYVFKGDNYWKVEGDRVASGYPRKISKYWPGLPANIDAALTWKTNEVTYFFKGDQYWRFDRLAPSAGYPKDISNWPGLPSNLDAAFAWGTNENLYFFKGSQYWKYDTDLHAMADGYPKDTSSWQNVPGNVDAALKWKNGKTYFFKSGNYWRFNDETLAVDRANPTYPRDAGQWWFGCPKKKRPNIPFVDATDPGYVEKLDTEQ